MLIQSPALTSLSFWTHFFFSYAPIIRNLNDQLFVDNIWTNFYAAQNSLRRESIMLNLLWNTNFFHELEITG